MRLLSASGPRRWALACRGWGRRAGFGMVAATSATESSWGSRGGKIYICICAVQAKASVNRSVTFQ